MSPAPAVPVSSVGIAPPPGSLPPTAAGVVAGSGSHPAAGSSAAAPPLTTTSAPSHRPARRRSRSVSTSSSLGSHLASDDDDDDEGDELSDDDSSTDGRVEAALDRLPPPPPVPSQGGPFAKKAKHDSPPGGQHLQQQHQHQMQHQLQLQQQQQGGNQPARKQNVACDPCRSRKVKCLRTNGSEKCDSCLQKTLVCTNHYVTSLQNKERRKANNERAARTKNGTGAGGLDIPGAGLAKRRKVSDERLPMATDGSSSSSYGGRHEYDGSYSSAAGPSSSSVASSSILPPVVSSHVSHQPAYQPFLPPALHYPGANGNSAQGYGGSVSNAVGGGHQHQHPLPFPVGIDQMPLPLPHPGAGPSTGPRYLQQQQQRQQQAGPSSYLLPPQQHPAYGQPVGPPQQPPPPQQPQQLYRQTSNIAPAQPAVSSLPPPPVHSAIAGSSPPLAAFPPPMASLLAYLFSPTEVATPELGYTDQTLVGHAGGKRELFDSPPSPAHRSLLSEGLRMELANDLIESYFQIVHIRMPLIAQSIFKAKFAASTASHVKLAVILALGAKFSEHPTIAMDREQTSAGGTGVIRESTSRLVRLLVARAQQVLEVNRAYRTPTLENIQAALLMEGLLNPFSRYVGSSLAKPAESIVGRNVTSHSKGFWTTVAIRHLLELRCNHMQTILAVEDELRRGALLFAWWLACLSDSMGALFWRQKPVLCDDDYDNEPPAAWDGEHYQPVDNPDEYKKWYISAHDLAKIAREACSRLWTPRVESAGIPLAALQQLVNLLCGWRDVHLSTVAVPNQWPSSWDFVHAVTACAADSNFHVMWLTLHRALVDFDILEAKEIAAGRAEPAPELVARIDSVRSQLSQEAAHAATRISALAVVLTTNGYLRLDPNVLHYPILEAGTFLARYGMTEVEGCIAGLRQYGTSYEECYAQADALEQSYARHKGQGGPPVAISAPPLYAGGAGQLQPEPMVASRRTSYSPSGDVVPAAARLALDSTPASEGSASSATAMHDPQPSSTASAYAALTAVAAPGPPATPSLPEQAAATLTRWSLSPTVDSHTKVYGGFAPAPNATAFAQGS